MHQSTVNLIAIIDSAALVDVPLSLRSWTRSQNKTRRITHGHNYFPVELSAHHLLVQQEFPEKFNLYFPATFCHTPC